MNEHRRLPRWRINEPMKVQFHDRYEFSDGMVEDINMKGMCLSLPARLPQHRPVSLQLHLNKRNRVLVSVDIPWVKEEEGRYLHGVEFKHVLEQDKEMIYQYISDRCMKQLEAGWWHDVN